MIIADKRFKWGTRDSNINWSDELRRGWIPVDIGRRDPVVRWMRIGTGVLQEPFFKDSISRFRAINGVAEFESSYSLVSEGTLDLPLVAPAGIIVHMTRCGSTLVLNALKAAEGVVGLGEADPVDGLLGLGVAGSGLWTRTCLDLLPRVMTLFAGYQGESQRRVIVKCGVWGAFGLSLFHRIWPEVPCLILTRDPVEVLVSNWLRPPGWIQDTYLKSGGCPLGTPPTEALTVGGIAPCSWAIGQICSEALKLENESWFRIVDYRNLTSETIRGIAAWFGLRYSDEGEKLLSSVLKVDSKRPGKEFARDDRKKQAVATEEISVAAARWIRAPYQELVERSYRPWIGAAAE